MRFLIINAIAFASLIVVAALWTYPFVVLIALAVLSAAALLVERSRSAGVLYVLCGVLGSSAEAFAVAFGAWSYATPQVLGVPLWLIPLWGLAGIYVAAVSRFVRRFE